MKSRKYLVSSFLVLLFSMLFVSNAQNQPKLLVYYFHATSRCPVDLAIEKIADETLKTYFADALKNQIIVYQAVDYDDNYNRELVEKYKPFGSSLMLVDANNNTIRKDFTDFAYRNVEEHPEKVIELLIKEIKVFIE